jgi:phosphatidylserine decarboxylase
MRAMSKAADVQGARTATPPTLRTPPTAPDKPAPIIAPEGVPIIAAFVIGSALVSGGAVWWLGSPGWIVAGVCGVLTLWCIWFFRDPRRAIPQATGEGEPVICPADGVISFVGPAAAPKELGLGSGESGGGLTRVSVFMNVFNVHVNRAPLAGVVAKTVYTPGKFVNAALDKASEHNERMSLVIDTDRGFQLICVQIAGLIARRIVCRVSPGTRLEAGERFGIIRFGSRVDVYLPAGVEPAVKLGDKTVAGSTVLAWLPRATGPGRAGGA